eukprot:9420344-Pyramimonas_sp.AAC.1
MRTTSCLVTAGCCGCWNSCCGCCCVVVPLLPIAPTPLGAPFVRLAANVGVGGMLTVGVVRTPPQYHKRQSPLVPSGRAPPSPAS